MLRRFREHDLRPVTELTGIWDFAFLGDCDPEKLDITSIKFTDRMAAPGCFDATPAYAGKRGLAAYRTHVLVCDDMPHRLILDGVNHWCRVFAGDRKLGEHSVGFTRFALDLVDHRPGEVEIIVLVENRFDYQQ